MARSPSTNMNFWARAPLNLVADRVKNSVPPLLRTLRFCVGGQEAELHDHSTDHTGGGEGRQSLPGAQGGLPGGGGSWRKGVVSVRTTGSGPRRKVVGRLSKGRWG